MAVLECVLYYKNSLKSISPRFPVRNNEEEEEEEEKGGG